MKAPKRRTIAVFALVVVVAAAAAPFVHFPVAPIRNAISRSLGRSVEIGSASLQLAPRPGIELENVTISEDPAFGSEPMMTAPSVIATLRASSIWHHRLEFGSIRFQDSNGVAPSFNLVRRADGEWNVESLMARAAAVQRSAPVPGAAGRGPHFPYIEVTSGRLNFKFGIEKKVVALTEADLALWADSDHEWKARLKARPIRTDANLSDTGAIEAETAIDKTPGSETKLNLQARLQHAQLGQLSALIYGRDRGWRGDTDADLQVRGPLPHPTIELRARIDGFRRYDIVTSDPLRLETACRGELDLRDEAIEVLQCTVPYGDGHIAVTGAVRGLEARAFNLALQLQDVPLARVLALVRRAKRDLPQDLSAQGVVDAKLTASRASRGEPGTWAGEGKLRELALSAGGEELRFPDISLSIGQDADGLGTSGFRLTAKPFNLSLGSDKPVTVAAQFDASAYHISVAGPVGIADAFRAARLVGMRAPGYQVSGSANVQFLISGNWAGFAPPLVTGAARIANASMELAGIAGPLRITSAQLELNETAASLSNVAATLGPKGLALSGSIQIPRGCGRAEQCLAKVDVKIPELKLQDASALAAGDATQPWYHLFSGSNSQPRFLMRARATGRVSIGRLVMPAAAATSVSSDLELSSGRLRLRNLQAVFLGGRHSGTWTADFTGPQPTYFGEGSVRAVDMGQVAKMLREECCSGLADGSYSVSFVGRTAQALLDSADGRADFTWRNGALSHFALPVVLRTRGAKPVAAQSSLHFSAFQGHAELHSRSLKLSTSKIATPNGIYQVAGNVALDHTVKLTLACGTQRFGIAGTIDAPEIAAEHATEVAAPPQPTATPIASKSGPGAN